MIYGVMLKSVKLTGTSLELQAGQIVELYPATNIPAGDGRYYAQPAQDEHGRGGGSILLNPGDVEVYKMTLFDRARNVQQNFKCVCDAPADDVSQVILASCPLYHMIDDLISQLTTITWICGCGTVNGINLNVCRVCGRSSV